MPFARLTWCIIEPYEKESIMDTYEFNATKLDEEQQDRFDRSEDQDHFWNTSELDLHVRIERYRRLSSTYYPI